MPTKLSNASWILGSARSLSFVWVLRWQKSIKSIGLHPSFKAAPLHYTMPLSLGWIAPESNISCRCAWTSFTNGGGIHLNCSLNGVVLVTLITCSVECIQLSSLGSKEKMSWYCQEGLGRICQLWWPGFQSTQIQLLKQLFLPLLHGHLWHLEALSNASITPVHIGGSGNCVTATALTTGVLFHRVWGYTVLFLTTTATFLLPLHNPV